MPLSSVVLSEDGHLLATLDCVGRIGLWEVISGKRIRRLECAAAVHDVVFSPNGSLLAACANYGEEHAVLIWDVNTGVLRERLRAPPDRKLLSLAFAPNGNVLAACCDDGTPVVWNVSNETAKPPSSEVPNQRALQQSWLELLSGNAAVAHQAIVTLSAHPELTVPFLRRSLKPVGSQREPLQLVLNRALRDMDADEFATRELGEAALLRLGPSIAAQLHEQLRRRDLSLEVRRRLQRVLQRLPEPVASAGLLREMRAIRVLECAGNTRRLETVARACPERRRKHADPGGESGNRTTGAQDPGRPLRGAGIS